MCLLNVFISFNKVKRVTAIMVVERFKFGVGTFHTHTPQLKCSFLYEETILRNAREYTFMST